MTPALSDIPRLIEILPPQEQQFALDFVSRLAYAYSPDAYNRILEQDEDNILLQLSADRLSHFSPDKAVSSEEIDQEFGWTEQSLSDIEDVELE